MCIENLRKLAAVCEDGVEAFEQSVKDVGDKALMSLFRELSISRKFAAVEFRKQLRQRNADTREGGTLKGTALRLYGKVKSNVAGNEPSKVLECLEESEQRAIDLFDEVLQERDLPPDVRGLVKVQRESLSTSIASIRALKSSYQMGQAQR